MTFRVHYMGEHRMTSIFGLLPILVTLATVKMQFGTCFLVLLLSVGKGQSSKEAVLVNWRVRHVDQWLCFSLICVFFKKPYGKLDEHPMLAFQHFY